MKSLTIFVVALYAAVAAASPSVSVTGLTIDAVSGEVVVSYSLADGPAIVTAAFTADGVPVPEQNATRLRGDVNRKVTGDAGTIRWDVRRDMPSLNASAMGVTLTAWPCDNPPDYMVVDLRTADTVNYYTSTNALPGGGLANELYRTGSILLRKIPAAKIEWYKGDKSYGYWVTLTENYYIGVYELTQQQMRLMGWAPGRGQTAEFSNLATGPICTDSHGEVINPSTATLPSVHNYVEIRGATNSTTCWPERGHAVGVGTPLEYVRNLTGVAFDLPTDAQWEFACRAGTATDYYNGKDASANSGRDPNLDPLAWYDDGTADKPLCPRPVGLKQPNAWGLYDMLGNVYENVLDINASSPYEKDSHVTDPQGPASTSADATKRILRGDSWFQDNANARPRASRRQLGTYNNTSKNYVGSRLCCPVAAP